MLLKLLTFLIVCLSALSISGCTSPTITTTPEAAIRRIDAEQERNRELQNIQVCGRREWQGKTLLLFSGTRRMLEQTPPQQEFGYAFVQIGSRGWTVMSSKSSGGTPPPPLVIYDSSQIQDAMIVFGGALSDQVQAVEATFDTGAVVRDIVKNQCFALIAPHTKGVIEVRLINRNGQVIKMYHRLYVGSIGDE